MSNYSLIIIILIYLFFLFLIAFIAEKKKKSKWVNNPYIYTLSLAVYCSAWTYYGSVGIAANQGIDFLPIYLGPVIAAPIWILLLRKIIRISKQHKISSIADFISLRYGNNRFLAGLVTVVCLFGTIPYISLQLKAVSETFEIMTNKSGYTSISIFDDSTFYVSLLLAVFATFFGTQKSDASQKHTGVIASVAFESILKLVFFLIVGAYVTFYVFDGTTDIYNQISKKEYFTSLITINGVEEGFNWFFMICLSFLAIFLLPRQFQVSVLENTREKDLKKAIWLFPLYLLFFNFFVIFIAWAGKITFGDTLTTEYYSLILPLENDNIFLATLVFLGGFSAIISMVIISTIALSNMVSNNLIIPYGFLNRFLKNQPKKNEKSIKIIRRFAIFLIIIFAYFFYISFSKELSLYSIGLISFVIIAQLAPSFFIGLFWNRGSSKGAIIGIIIGFLISVYTLVLPFTLYAYSGSNDFVDYGFLHIENLKPYALFGIDFLSAPAHAFFWSIFFNLSSYLIFSLFLKSNYRERNYAEMFVYSSNFSSIQDNAFVWKGEAYVKDIKSVLVRFLGEQRANRALSLFFRKYNLDENTQLADARLINFSEKLLTGNIGSASAKILIASVVKEEEISLKEVLKILEESKENILHNKILTSKSEELTHVSTKLKDANIELIKKDKQKDEFLDTVAHEIKTPITGIRAATELLLEDMDEMPSETKNQFLKNILNDSERLSRLINNILDFENLETGRLRLNLEAKDIQKSIQKSIASVAQIAANKGIIIQNKNLFNYTLLYDEDKIIQVFTNLLSNAIKFCPKQNGHIIIDYRLGNSKLEITVKDNGKGIPAEDFEFIFQKFYQSKNQNTLKPTGSGLGLAITKQIVEKHKGKIWAERDQKNGAKFVFTLPFN